MILRFSALIGLGLLSAGLSSPAAAQAQAPCSEDIHRHFDFWVGDWNVYLPDGGAYAGRNLITSTQAGCLIEEDWTGAAGSSGHSMNFYDPLIGAWRQVWVSAGAVIDYSGGLDADGAMVLTGEIFYPATGQCAPFRGAWTAQ